MNYDVLIAGGGPAGVNAAIASARTGAKTLLIERHGFLGGGITAGLVNWPGGFHTESGRQVIAGVPQELVDRCVAMGSPGHQISPVRPGRMTITVLDEEHFKRAAEETALASGVELLYHAFIFDVKTRDGRIHSVRAATKSGALELRASVFVDATGDGDLVAGSGAAFIKAPALLPATTFFKVSHVDAAALVAHMQAHRDAFRQGDGWFRDIWDPELRILWCDLAVFAREWDKAVAEGRLSPAIDRQHSGIGILRGTDREDEISVNMTRVCGVDGTDAASLTRGEVEGRRQVDQCVAWLRGSVPGFAKCRLEATASQIGIREGRRLDGEYCIKASDVTEGRDFEDGIGRNAIGLDIHATAEEGGHQWVPIRDGGSHSIPFGALLPKGCDNLLAAGRCVSADDRAFGAVRWCGPCMVTGQAAGAAAALAARQRSAPRDIDRQELRSTLAGQGVVL